MPDPHLLAQQFVAALTAADPAAYTPLLAENAGLRVYGWAGGAYYRPRERLVAYLQAEWQSWADPSLEVLNVVAEANRIALEIRIQLTDATGRYVEHCRSIFLTLQDGRIQFVDLYCAEPVPSARRKNWLAQATLTTDEIGRLFDSLRFSYDPREWLPPDMGYHWNLREFAGGTGDSHPGSNIVSSVRWSEAEAEAKIGEIIGWHQQRQVGFQWLVSPYDRPKDLGQRLLAQGFSLAGTMVAMAKLGLTDFDQIPSNPHVTVQRLDSDDETQIETRLAIVARCFRWTPTQVARRRFEFFARARNPVFREREFNFLAYQDGVPVAEARLLLQAGVAYLGGASTLPAYRNQRIYSTLLRCRLAEAQARGYQVAAIHAEPMSYRVVKRYGFQEYDHTQIYVWMPVLDVAVAKSLVPDE